MATISIIVNVPDVEEAMAEDTVFSAAQTLLADLEDILTHVTVTIADTSGAFAVA